MANLLRAITGAFHSSSRTITVGALALGLLASAVNVHAVAYVWTNTTGSVYNDTNAWNPIGGPGGPADSATISFTGTLSIPLTSDFIQDTGNILFGAAASSGTLNLNLDFGTNVFEGISGNTSSASGFVFGNAGTVNVFIAVGRMLCTNSTGNARMIVGRQNGPTTLFLTNGNVKAGNLIIVNGATASGTKLVIDGANSFWTNNTTVVGNAPSASNVTLVVSNSGVLASTNGFTVGAQSPNNFCSVLIDSNGRLVTSNQTPTIGVGSGSSSNSVTIQGGGLWDVGVRPITIGNAGGGSGNALIVGNNGKVQNVTALTLASSGNALVLSGGVFSASVGVTNNDGTVGGFGTIAGNVVFAGTGTLSPGIGTLVGTLTISNNLTLVSGSTTKIKLDSSQTGSNDSLKVIGTSTIAGTLTVLTNGIAPLTAGDIYNIGTTGSFTTTNLPSLNPTYRWDNVTPGILAIVPQEVVPGMEGPTNQVVNIIGSETTISVTVTGVPTPGVYWQKDGTNLTDGVQGSGAIVSGSQTASLVITNLQTSDSGSYCAIATNIVGAATNCMALTVSTNAVPPSISGVSDQTVIEGNNGTFNASVAGFPSPAIQWQENAVDIAGATGVPLVLTNVQFSQNGYIYTLIASNEAGVATTNLTLTVIVPPTISAQPQNLTITNTQSASFSVTASGVPSPAYQWFFNNNAILNATNSTYTLTSAVVSNAGTYKVQVSNTAGSVTSSNATLTVNSIMSATLSPSNTAANVCYDTPLFMTFDLTPFRSGTGSIKIYAGGTTNIVDTIDTSLGNLQSRSIGGESFFTFPVIITGNVAAIYPHLGVLTSNQTYYVTVDPGTFTDTNGALHAGITSTNAWVFTTKPTGPSNPNSIVVAADGSGDFCTVQGAVDFVPVGNGVNRLVNIRNGTYTELVNTRTKSNITFRGQSRTGTVVGYHNNQNQNAGTHFRMAFKVFSDDIAIENMTVVNTTPQGGTQAEALMLETNIKRFICNNADVNSRQDTILANVSTTQAYFNNSLIQGNFDYIWGGGNCFFTNCEVRTIPTTANYNVTAARTDNGGTGNWQGPDGNYSSNGFSFVNCRFTRADNSITNITLAGGNGNPNANVAWIGCQFDTAAYRTPLGSIISNSIFWVYANSNLDNTASATFDMITVLTNGDARLVAASDAYIWLNGWNPSLAPNILSSPTNLTVNSGQAAAFSVSATGVPNPLYQWLKAGTNLVGQTSATLSIPATVADDAGTYSVVVSNVAGSVTNSATLTVIPTAFEAWQQLYFGCTSCPQAAANADPDGDGLTNDAEFQAGTNPTNAASGLRIISNVPEGNNIVITWTTAGGRTNVVQASAGDGSGGYDTNFTDLSGLVVITGSGDQTTNYADGGGATNVPSRYYRIRLVP